MVRRSRGPRLAAALLFVLPAGVTGRPVLRDGASATQPTPPAIQAVEPESRAGNFEPAQDLGVPEEYSNGVAYLGSFREAWRTEALFDPILGKVFLALESGASRQTLEKLGIPDLDQALADLTTSRMIRKVGDTYGPAFPVIRGETGAAFDTTVRQAARDIYPEILPFIRRARKAAKKEKVSPWLFALLWSEMLDSRTAEETLGDAGALDARRLRDEGYLWIQVPADPLLMGVDRYSSGSETLHYLWTPFSYLNQAVQDYPTRRRILDGALGHLPWTDDPTEEAMKGFGILDGEKRVAVPALRKHSTLLSVLRKGSQLYARRALAAFGSEALGKSLKVSRDEAFIAAFTTLGFRMMAMALQDDLVQQPDYLARGFSPPSGLVEALVVTPDEVFTPLNRAYYLYDRNDFAGCIQQVDDYLKPHPDDPEALFRKGIAYMKLRKYPEALAAFGKGISLPAAREDVWHGWLLVRDGNVLDLLNRRDEARARYEEALGFADVNGSHERARFWLENVYQD